MRVSLKPTRLIPSAGGRVDLNPQTGEIRIIATGLPDIETVNFSGTNNNGVYQVWWENNGMQKLGVLRKGLDRTHFLNVVVPRGVFQEIKRLLVSVEPESGAVTPGQNLILTADIVPSNGNEMIETGNDVAEEITNDGSNDQENGVDNDVDNGTANDIPNGNNDGLGK
jgi:hypothetical protein